MSRLAILGTGMAGLGAAHRLGAEGVEPVLYDKLPYAGGHTASFRFDEGFVFDDGPHISFTKDERFQELLAAAVKGEFEVLQAEINNHWKGHWIKHPAQVNLHGLPDDLVVDIVRDFVEAQARERGEIANYEEWLFASFGETFARTFPMEYGEKYHTLPASRMSTDWLGPRLYRPKLEEVLRGALSPARQEVHYVSHFRYPTRGGFQGYVDGLLEGLNVVLEHEAVKIDPVARRIDFANGSSAGYDQLVSSVPLPLLIPMVEGAPPEVVEQAKLLAWSQCLLVNLGIDRADLSDAHWTYFYDRDFTVTRLSFPHMYSRHNVPEGCGSMQAEVYFSNKYRPMEKAPEEYAESVIADLRRCGLLRDEDEITFRHLRVTPFANVIFDHDRAKAVAAIHAFLDEVQIAYCGRYGEWGYQWTDESFKSGEAAAQKALDRL